MKTYLLSIFCLLSGAFAMDRLRSFEATLERELNERVYRVRYKPHFRNQALQLRSIHSVQQIKPRES